ncbi:unnamed protein product [Parascedosporium putredinis]|uniref:C2H2-type domain-containing protein n=1 Tax=Parascedosporium putredinis TaxID=1442378 RepID=A0A9P1H8V0_9PEZI|nr:unnamed protein product [Parascedosporium putredinis]CAI8000195.1 unnamed protein product [Parascedosporium putredinis]
MAIRRRVLMPQVLSMSDIMAALVRESGEDADVRLFECSRCHRKFARPDHLTRHIRSLKVSRVCGADAEALMLHTDADTHLSGGAQRNGGFQSPHLLWDQYMAADDLSLRPADQLFDIFQGDIAWDEHLLGDAHTPNDASNDDQDAATPEQAVVVAGAKAFRDSIWHWIPGPNDFSAAHEPHLSLPQSTSQMLGEPPNNHPLAQGSVLPVADRDRTLSLLLSHCKTANIATITTSLISNDFMDKMLRVFFRTQLTDAWSWFHVPTFRAEECREELLLAFVSLGASLMPLAASRKLAIAISNVLFSVLGKKWTSNSMLTRDLQLMQAFAVKLKVLLWSGNKRTMEMAESVCQPVITVLRRSGMVMANYYETVVLLDTDTEAELERKWHVWAEHESRISCDICDPKLTLDAEFRLHGTLRTLRALPIFAGKDGEASSQRIYPMLQEWTQTRDARQALWHAGQVYRTMRLMAGQVAREFQAVAIYQASLVFWVYGIIVGARNKRARPFLQAVSISITLLYSLLDLRLVMDNSIQQAFVHVLDTLGPVNTALTLAELHDRYGPVVRIAPNEVSISDWRAYREIYTNKANVKDEEFYGAAKFLRLENIFSMRNHAMHAARRKMQSQPYSQAAVLENEHLVASKARIMVDRMIHGALNSVSGETVDVYKLCGMFSLEVILQCAFNHDSGEQADGDSLQFLLAMDGSAPCMPISAVMPFIPKLGIGKYFPGFIGESYTNLEKWADITRGLLTEFENKEASLDKTKRFMATPLLTNRDDYLGRHLTPDEILEEAMGIAFAGSGTTSTTMFYIIYCLSLPESAGYQESLRKELVQAAAGSKLTIKVAQDLPWLNAVIKEAMRLHPTIISTLPRILKEDTTLVLAGGNTFVLPQGTKVGMQNYIHHRDPALFQDPKRFAPERWLTADPAKMKDMISGKWAGM